MRVGYIMSSNGTISTPNSDAVYELHARFAAIM
jgi:hypothetical protein